MPACMSTPGARGWTPAAARFRQARRGRTIPPSSHPNGWTLPYKVRDGVKVFHLIAEPVKHEFAPGLVGELLGL